MSYGKCNQCRKFGTPECPTSALCLRYEERPYFEAKPKEENMWTKIKTWLVIAGTAILGLFITLFGFTKRKLKKTEEKLEEKTKEVESHEKANDLQASAKTIEKDVEKEISEIKKETTEKLLNASTYDYNMEIKNFNERK